MLIVNIGFFINKIDPGFVDLLSTVSKIIIYIGMVQPSFSFLVDDLRSFLLGGIPTKYSTVIHGSLNLVNLKNATRERDVAWINERVDNNSKIGVRTVLITLYDLITARNITHYDENEDLYIVRILQGTRNILNTFEERIMSINDDLNQIDILFSDIINFSTERKVPCEIIIYTFSHMVHTHGWRRVYSFITTKIPLIKSSNVFFTGFYYPESHEKKSEILTFERMTDSIINQ